MSYNRPHFIYEDDKAVPSDFALSLMKEMGHATLKSCDVVISIGGDGMLLHSLKVAEGKPVYALTPPGSNSNGFWTDHGVTNADELKARLQTAQAISLTPLRADIHFTNGNSTIRHAFGDVAIERATGQSALITLSAVCGEEISEPQRILGDGFIFSTAFGSTGTSRSYNGPVADIHNNVIIMTGKGIYEPRGMAPLLVNGDDGTSFRADFNSVAHKRPVRIDYDGYSIGNDTDGSPIDSLTVSAAPEKAAKFLTNIIPAAKAFSTMMR